MRYIIECSETNGSSWFIAGSDRTSVWAINYAKKYAATHPSSLFRVTDCNTKQVLWQSGQ